MEFVPEPIRRAREQVEVQIREAILSGTLQSGERLPSETVLAQQLSVSRTTVREALRSLAATGLISKTPGAGGGTFVRSVDHRSLGRVMTESMEDILRLGNIRYEEVTEVREMLEVPAARLAAVNRDAHDIELLRQIVEAEKNTTIDNPEVPELDLNFHTSLAKASRNKVLGAFVFALHKVTRPVMHLEMSPEVGRETVRQHANVVKAVQGGDPDDAEKAIVAHLTYLATHAKVSSPAR